MVCGYGINGMWQLYLTVCGYGIQWYVVMVSNGMWKWYLMVCGNGI